MKSSAGSFYIIFVLIILYYGCSSQSQNNSVIDPSLQSILVLTDTISAVKGNLYYFNRENSNSDWHLVEGNIPVVLGRSGLGWGRGLHDSSNIMDYPIKKEGDGRSPAGIFGLSFVFGKEPDLEFPDLKMPYLQITEMTECIDDENSEFYNRIISSDTIKAGNYDWVSSEKMYNYGVYYELGVFVDHNSGPAEKGYGSCIFLHNWDNPDETMQGCTAMHPKNMKEIALWLDASKQPVFIQLTEKSYKYFLEKWNLPEIVLLR